MTSPGVRSDTAPRSRAFSRSSPLSCFTWSSFGPPNSARQRRRVRPAAPTDRTASAAALPCAAGTSTRRSSATISSGVCASFRPIRAPVRVRRPHRRRTGSRGAGQPPGLLPGLFWQACRSSSAADLFWPVQGRGGAPPRARAVPLQRGAPMHAQLSAPITPWYTND